MLLPSRESISPAVALSRPWSQRQSHKGHQPDQKAPAAHVPSLLRPRLPRERECEVQSRSLACSRALDLLLMRAGAAKAAIARNGPSRRQSERERGGDAAPFLPVLM